MDIVYEPDITYRRALQIDKMWAESDVTGKLYTEVVNMASLKGDERVLDVAASTGCLLQVLAEALPKGRAIGLDRSAAMVRLAQNKLVKGRVGNTSVLCLEGDDIMFKGAMFDMVFCVLGLYHFSDPLAALKEMNRVLKKGGKLILCEYEAPADPELRASLTESLRLTYPDYRFFTGPELYALVADAGFKRERSATERFTFDQHGIGGMPMGVHFFETRFMIERRGDRDLLASFDGNVFKPAGEMMRIKGTLNFAMVRAAK